MVVLMLLLKQIEFNTLFVFSLYPIVYTAFTICYANIYILFIILFWYVLLPMYVEFIVELYRVAECRERFMDFGYVIHRYYFLSRI